MCGGESYFSFFIISWVHSLILSHPIILSFYMCEFKNIGVCEVGKECCNCVKKKILWTLVENQITFFLLCFVLISWMQNNNNISLI